MKINKNKKVMSAYSFLLFLFLAQPALAQDPLSGTTGLDEAAQGTGLIMNTNIKGVVALVIRGLLSFLGALFLVLIIWGGFKWMTSSGSADRIKDAKNLIINATIGLVIVVVSYIIVYTVFEILGNATNVPNGEGGN